MVLAWYTIAMNDIDYIESLLKDYRPSEASIDIVKTTPLLFLVGISGAGKGTIKQCLLETGDYTKFVSHTTRSPRENNGVMEQNGVEYYFISVDTAIDMIKNGEYIEVKYYSGNVYGTTAEELARAKDSGKIALNDIEIQGIGEYLNISSSIKVIFIVPPSYKIWLERLAARYDGNINSYDLQLRLETAKHELETALNDARISFIINDDLDIAVQDVEKIVKHGSHDDGPARLTAQKIFSHLSSEDRDSETKDILDALSERAKV